MRTGGNHSTSEKRPGLTNFRPQGTSKPRFTRVGGRDSSAIQAEVATPVSVKKTPGPSSHGGFGKATHAKGHGAGKGDD